METATLPAETAGVILSRDPRVLGPGEIRDVLGVDCFMLSERQELELCPPDARDLPAMLMKPAIVGCPGRGLKFMAQHLAKWIQCPSKQVFEAVGIHMSNEWLFVNEEPVRIGGPVFSAAAVLHNDMNLSSLLQGLWLMTVLNEGNARWKGQMITSTKQLDGKVLVIEWNELGMNGTQLTVTAVDRDAVLPNGFAIEVMSAP